MKHLLRTGQLGIAMLLLTSASATYAQSTSNPSTSQSTTDKVTVTGLKTDEDGTYFTVSLESNTPDITYCAYNMVIALPPGLSFASENGNAEVYMAVDDGFYPGKKGVYDHTLGSKILDGKLSLMCYSGTNANFKSPGGTLLYVYVDVNPWAKEGANDVTISETVFVTKDEIGYVPETGVIGTVDVTTESRSVDVNISAENKIGTLILPFDYSFDATAGVKAYMPSEVKGEYLELEPCESLSAYHPYILLTENGFSGTLTAAASNVGFPADNASFVNIGGLCGTIAPTLVAEGYILQNQGEGPCFYKVGDTPYSLKAGKCYLAPISGAPMLAPRFNDSSSVTTMPQTGSEGIPYNLNGTRAAHPSVGNIYILNGKKVLKI